PPPLPSVLKPWVDEERIRDSSWDPVISSEALVSVDDSETVDRDDSLSGSSLAVMARPSVADHVCIAIDEDEADQHEERGEFQDVRLAPRTLAESPEVQSAWTRYVSAWRVWAAEHRRASAVQSVFDRLFRMRRQQMRDGEGYELVFALGCLSWKPGGGADTGHAVLRHMLVVNAEIEFEPQAGVISVGPAAPP